MLDDITNSWKIHLKGEFEKDYFKKLTALVERERNVHTIFPPEKLTFAALNKTELEETKVVIIGQDPYHNHGQANGLSFSVAKGMKLPPSLKNIFKEWQSDTNSSIPSSGDLNAWAEQGVLLLNATLTVRAHEPGSHQKKGWETFTDKIIELISENCKHVVFILWGNFAQKKITLIDEKKHFIIKSVHPSPFSARNGFFGSKPFSKCNEYLTSVNKKNIDWNLIDEGQQLSILD
jgi:uracil-DNA glycosylase